MTRPSVMPPRLHRPVATLVACALLCTGAAPARVVRPRAVPVTARPVVRSAPIPLADDGDPRVAQLAEVFDRLAAFGFSGQVVLGERGRVLLQRSAGWADADYRVPMSDSTQLGIGSVTKTFIAATVLRLQTRGRLDVESPLARYLPGVPADKQGITLHMLLTHTSGLPRDVRGIPDAAPRETVLARVLRTPLRQPPGTAFQYSNAGYDLLAAVIEAVTRARVADVVGRELLEPAGMMRTGWAHDWRDAGLAARGYNEWREVSGWTEWPERWRRSGSGAMVSTAADLWRWARALGDSGVLAPGERRRMFTRWATDPDSVGYGYGIYLSTLPNGRGVLRYHGGDVDGYRAEMRLYPDERRTVIVLTNHDQFGLGVHRRVIASLFIRLLRGDSAAVPPAVAHGEAARLGPWRGEYRVPGGGVIRIRELAGIPMLAAEGQAAVDLFLPPRDGPDPAVDANRRAFDAVVALARGDTAAALPSFHADERAFGYGFLRDNLNAYGAAFGELREVKLLGTAFLPWDRDQLRTWLRVTWADGSQGLFLGRTRGRLDDITFGDDRPAPVLLPVAVLADGTLGTWDVFTGRTVVMRRAPGGGLVVEGPDGDVDAARAR